MQCVNAFTEIHQRGNQIIIKQMESTPGKTQTRGWLLGVLYSVFLQTLGFTELKVHVHKGNLSTDVQPTLETATETTTRTMVNTTMVSDFSFSRSVQVCEM